MPAISCRKGARVLPIVVEGATDYRTAGEAADARLADLKWPPDLVWLGVGADGHTASIFPGPDLEDALNGPKTRRAVGLMPDPLPAEAPVARVTLSRAAILSARALLLAFSGDGEARGRGARHKGRLAFPHAHRTRSCQGRRSHRYSLERDMTLHPTIETVTQRIVERSRPTRDAYLDLIARERDSGVDRPTLSCGNLAHGFAAAGEDKRAIRDGKAMNIGIVTAYNDMLSAHQPYGRYPEQIKLFAREVGATAQVAGGVPAMCDGVTQGQRGMELSLFSRDTIALSTAIALSHGMFEAAALLGICDKIVPGLLIGALRFGHLPTILVPAGPMPSGLANKEKQRVRQLYAEGKVGRAELLEAEAASYHDAGTCTFYGTANSNQMMMEVMGLHIPGAAFVNPGTKLRQELTRAAVHRLAEIGWDGNDYRPLGRVVDEKAIVNAAVGLLATGGSTNHAHPPAGDRARGGDRDRLGGYRPAVGGRAADRADLSERFGRREPLPGRRRNGVHDRHPAATQGCSTATS